MNNKTFAIIKPDAVKNNFTGKIYNHILESGFKVLCAKLFKMSKNQAEILLYKLTLVLTTLLGLHSTNLFMI